MDPGDVVVHFAARAVPPLSPPSLPRATAAKFFVGFGGSARGTMAGDRLMRRVVHVASAGWLIALGDDYTPLPRCCG